VGQTCRLIERDAKVGAPVRKPGRGEPPGGRLRADIHTDLSVKGQVVSGKVGSNVRHAHVAHGGAKPHTIFPNRKRMLSFYWSKAPVRMVTARGPHAGKVALRKVSHPGMKGVRYLTVPLLFWGHMRGFKVYILRD
jgi:hypothetical protein